MRISGSGLFRDLPCLLQFLPRPPNLACDTYDGSWARKSRLEFAGVGGIIGGQNAGGNCLKLTLAMNVLALVCWVAAIPRRIQSNRSKLVSRILSIAGIVLMATVSLRWFFFLQSH